MNRHPIDPLTGAFDRSFLVQQMHRWIEISQVSATEFAVVIVDLDYFKSINDAFGHRRGDQVLVEVVQRIKKSIRNQDQVFRYGGDEFVILLPGSSKSQAVTIVERIRESMIALPMAGQPPVSVSASFGLAAFPHDSETPEGLFEAMDRRLYQGKMLGRGRIIHEEKDPTGGGGLKPPERLVERDFDYRQGLFFLQRLPEIGSGVLQVSGRPGMGRSRFLAEVGKLARLRGYAVWSIKGSKALRLCRGGLLARLQQLVGLAPVRYDPAQLAESFGQWVADKGLDGLLICVDEIEGADSYSLGVLKQLLETQRSFPLGLVYTSYQIHDVFPPFAEISDRTHLTLQPLSRQGVHIWLRSTLGWEPPEAWIDWFFRQTAGVPKIIMNGLRFLLDQGVLRSSAEEWSINGLNEQLDLAAALEQLPQPRVILPEIHSELYGREDELWKIRQLLERRLMVTICGPDGLGKSRLALQAAAELQERFQDGVLWIAMQGRQSREDLLFSLAQVWDPQVKAQQTSEEEVFRLYRGRQVLVVIDDLAPASEAAGLASRLAAVGPGLSMLITSSLPLSFSEESVIAIQGLPFPGEDQIKNLENWPAVQLFLATARSSSPAFQPGPEDWTAIARICRLLNGTPLAIELAAAWVSSFPCAQIAGRIEENADFLIQQTVNEAARPHNHQAIRAVLDSFWQLFSENEKNILAALANFDQSFTAQAASAVADASPFFLDALLAKRMIHLVSVQRYAMHPLLVGFARARMKTAPDFEKQVRRRHAEYYLHLLAAKTDFLRGGQHHNGSLPPDLGNIQRAWEYAAQNGFLTMMDAGLEGLSRLFFNIGHFLEGVRLIQYALENLPTPAGLDGVARLRARLLGKMGEFYFHTGQYSQGLLVLEEAAQIFGRLHAVQEHAEVLRLLANVAGALGQYDRAIDLLNEGMAMVQEESYPELAFNLMNRAGVMAYFKKDYALADRYLDKALEIARRLNDVSKIVVVLNNHGNVALDAGRVEQARQLLTECAALLRDIEGVTLRASVLDSLAKTLTAGGEFQAAAGYFAEALNLVMDIDAAPLTLEILTGVAEMVHALQKTGLARALVEYIRTCTSVPNDILVRAEALAGLCRHEPLSEDSYQWKDRPLRWVVVDVVKILYTDFISSTSQGEPACSH